MTAFIQFIKCVALLGTLAQPCAHADVFQAVTESASATIGPEYFGTHFHRLIVLPNEVAVPTEWPTIALGTIRLWDSGASWRDLSIRAGDYQFARMDIYLDAAAAHHASVLYTLGSTPQWASARPAERCSYGFGCAAEPADSAAWVTYVRRVARRYGSHIGAYEMWNEPNFSDITRDAHTTSFYNGSVAAMVDLTRATRAVLDQESPGAKLCTPGFVNGPDRLDLYLAAGGRRYVQAICYHFYSGSSADFARQILEVRRIMRRNGVENLPLWNTETGVDTLKEGDAPSGIAAHTHSAAVARLTQMLVLGAAAGIERFYYYAWDNFRSGMVRADGSHLPGYAALQRLQAWMLGSRFTGCGAHGELVQCTMQRGNERYVLAWSDKDNTAAFDIPAGWQVAGFDQLLDDQKVSFSSAPRIGPMPVSVHLVRQPSP